jgi:ABC-type phosphate transport system substrate-binding protein
VNLKTARRLVVATAAVAVVAGAISVGTASADPSGSPTYREFAGVGSDTVQGVYDQFGNDIKIGGTKVIGSYDAFPGGNISTQAAAACQNVARPNGSGAGATAIQNSLNANSGAGDTCVQFSRSSSGPGAVGSTTPALTYVPFATDAVTYMVTATSSIPRQLTQAQLTSIYACSNFASTGIKALVPQAGSGTRKFWEPLVGVTDSNVDSGAFPCLKDTNNGTSVEEHDGRALDDLSIAPISIAQNIAQEEGTISDVRGQAVLGQIANADGVTYNLPILMNSTVPFTREVYSVIPKSVVGVSTGSTNGALNTDYNTVFVGANSLICKDTADITTYGFAIDPNCGSTTQHT